MSLTDQQQNALPKVRAHFNKILVSYSTAESVDERARLPNRTHVPTDVAISVEIAPPSPLPPPFSDGIRLRTTERVPIYIYALRNDSPESDVANTRVIFYIHGGGNVMGHPIDPWNVHFYTTILRAVASHSVDARPCVLLAPSYRLATVPENAFPAALQDLVAAYDHVLAKGYRASNTVIAGDSVGGNHAVVLTHLVLQSNRPSPRGVVSIGPSAICGSEHMSEYAKAQASADVIYTSNTDMMARLYVGDTGLALTDPLISGAFISFDTSWPRTLILVGTADQLIDGALELKRRLVVVGRPVELVEYSRRPHAWWMLADIFPDDIHDAAQRIAHFVVG